MSASWFYVFLFGIVFFAVYRSFGKIFPAMIFLFVVLLFFSRLLPAYVLSFVQFVCAFTIAIVLYRLFASKLQN